MKPYYITTAIDYTKVTILDTFGSDAQAVAHHGEVHVVSRVVGFKKIKFHTNENVGSGELDLPEQQMHTTSYWLEVPAKVLGALPYAVDDRRDGVRGLAFAMKNIALGWMNSRASSVNAARRVTLVRRSAMKRVSRASCSCRIPS